MVDYNGNEVCPPVHIAAPAISVGSGERTLKMAHGPLTTMGDEFTTTIYGAEGDQYLVVADAESGAVVIEGQTVAVIP